MLDKSNAYELTQITKEAGALVLRVHDVREVRQALAVATAIAHVDENAS